MAHRPAVGERAAAASGELAPGALPPLLLRLRRERFAGTLELARGKVRKRIAFDGGHAVAADSNVAGETLVSQLLESGALSRDDQARVAARVRAGRLQEGAALLELGLLTPRALFDALRAQLRRRVVECFGWSTGRYSLDAQAAPAAEARAFRTDVCALIVEGIAAHWGPERVMADLAPVLTEPLLAGEPARQIRARLPQDAALDKLLAGLDGTATLAEAIHTAGSARALAAAWLLHAAGALEAAGATDATTDVSEIEVVVRDTDAGVTATTPAATAPTSPSRHPKAAALERDLRALHGKLDALDHYALLEVARDAPADSVRRAYMGLAKRFHPDGLARYGLEALRPVASALFARIATAQKVLCDAQARADYDASLGGASVDVGALAQAETLFRKGEILLRAGNFAGALEFLEPAVELWPDEAAYQAGLGWALFRKRPSDPERACQHLERAASLDGADAEVHSRLAQVRRVLGRG